MFHQPTLEHALRARLAEMPRSRRGFARAQDYEVAGDGIVAQIESGDGAYEIAARFIVGCDGGNSTVRRKAGIALDDMGFDEPWLVVDTVLKNGVTRLSTIGFQHCDPKRPVTSMPMAPGRHRFEIMLRPGEKPEDVVSDEAIAAMIAPYADASALDIERRAVYRFHAVIAKTWRAGPVILAGDAAHQMPPFLGQGLCSGTRDAANLAFKIEAVLRGRANECLLDSYQAEREPHVRMITEMAVAMGRVVCTQDAEAARQRDEQLLAAPEASRMSPLLSLDGIRSGILESGGAIAPDPGFDDRRLDDAAGYAALLIVRAEDDASRAFAGAGGLVARLDALPDSAGHLAAAMGDRPAILIRPDRYVFGAGETAALTGAWAAYLASGKAAASAAAA